MDVKEIFGQTIEPTFKQVRMVKDVLASCPYTTFLYMHKLAKEKGYTLALMKELDEYDFTIVEFKAEKK
jgi:hypothetical protein